MEIKVRNNCSDFNSYRAARVKSLFNAESGCNFNLDATLPIDDEDWQIGMVVGPSGSGKTSIGRAIGEHYGQSLIWEPEWSDKPIVEDIAPDGSFDAVTAALGSVGLGDVPAWLRPYGVLSNGEQFRASLARLISEAPDMAIVDEFTSVVDRQIAQIGAQAFAKGWRRHKTKKVVLLSCHYDILDWVQPDWVYDTARNEFSGRWLRRREPLHLDIHKTDWRYWHLFEPHHYLKIPRMVGAICYVGTVNDELVCHIAVGTLNVGAKGLEARACRMVVMPEWQGAGVGTKFLNAVAAAQLEGGEQARMPGRSMTTLFHTTHPGLCAYLRRNQLWRQLTCKLYGDNKNRFLNNIRRAAARGTGKSITGRASFGGHFRAVQGFRYIGHPPKGQADA